MDWAVETEAEWTMLGRIVALLYSLADLAERAAGRSLATRHLVLGFLRLAESVARKMVIRDSQHFGVYAPGLLIADRIGASADDAMRLARRFRELALALEGLVALILVAGRRARACASRFLGKMILAMRPLLVRLARRPDCRPIIPFDTS